MDETTQEALGLCYHVATKLQGKAGPSAIMDSLGAFGVPEQGESYKSQATRLIKLQALIGIGEERGWLDWRHEPGGLKIYFVTPAGMTLLREQGAL